MPTFGPKPITAITPKDVRDWHATTLVDRPTMRSHAYSLLRTILASAVVDQLIDANPARIVGAGRARRVHKIRPASVEELAVLTEAMPERLRLMVTLASWCALRFGETVELRRGDIELSDEVIRIRRAAVRTGDGYTVTTPKSDAGVRDVAIPPYIIPLIEEYLAEYVGKDRDSLIFPRRPRRPFAAVDFVPALVPRTRRSRTIGPAVARPTAFRRGARGRHRRHPWPS